MARRSYTVGIIGLGFGRAHIPAFQAAGATVVAVCQRNLNNAQAIAARYGIPQAFERWEDLLERAKPEIVVIATPPYLRRQVCLRALSLGMHVLCEKPLALNLGEAREMVEARAKANRVGGTVFCFRYPAAMQKLHQMVADGFLGRLFHVSCSFSGARYADEATKASWRVDRSLAGVGAMGDFGVHVIDSVRWNFGEFVRVCAQTGIAYPSRQLPEETKAADADDYCTLLAELDSGAQVTLSVSRAARGANGEFWVDAYGSQGALSYRLRREGKLWYRGRLHAASGSQGFQPIKTPAGLPRSAGQGDPMEVTGKAMIAPLVKGFLAAIRGKESAFPTLEDGMRAQAVLDAVVESAARRTWVDVPRL
jgi:predicted dehydrogenase